ncbi:YraN family protein [Methylohalobius crimeensis]|uniref:YraN family protein n=1 Tax=Methylohalobius crimeensis TaxID=244365 RepID=UPI0003B45E53|nr:YraN family protein [Methylohalobius crimeensis]
MRSRSTTALGQAAENHALAYLEKRGLKLLTRNYRWRGGEIDLILEDRGTLVFAEVRFRRNNRFGGALASVDARKQKRLIQCAQHYLVRHREDAPVRFDVVALTATTGGFELEWVRDAFQAEA